MLHGPAGQYGGGDVRAAGLIMVAGSDLIMVALAVALAWSSCGAEPARGAPQIPPRS